MTLLSSARMSAAILALGALTAVPAHAAGIDGSSLGLTWAVPFAGILLSIALCPLFLPHFWHKNFGKVAVPYRSAPSSAFPWVLTLSSTCFWPTMFPSSFLWDRSSS